MIDTKFIFMWLKILINKIFQQYIYHYETFFNQLISTFGEVSGALHRKCLVIKEHLNWKLKQIYFDMFEKYENST